MWTPWATMRRAVSGMRSAMRRERVYLIDDEEIESEDSTPS
jgi:hypothetical protein